ILHPVDSHPTRRDCASFGTIRRLFRWSNTKDRPRVWYLLIPPLAAIDPSKICCLTFSSCSVMTLSSRRFCKAASPCLKAFMLPQVRVYPSSCHFVSFLVARFIFHCCYWQSRRKLNKFLCVFSRLDAL